MDEVIIRLCSGLGGKLVFSMIFHFIICNLLGVIMMYGNDQNNNEFCNNNDLRHIIPTSEKNKKEMNNSFLISQNMS